MKQSVIINLAWVKQHIPSSQFQISDFAASWACVSTVWVGRSPPTLWQLPLECWFPTKLHPKPIRLSVHFFFHLLSTLNLPHHPWIQVFYVISGTAFALQDKGRKKNRENCFPWRADFKISIFFWFIEHREVPVCCSKLWVCYKAQGSGEEIFLFTEHRKDPPQWHQCRWWLAYVGSSALPQEPNLLVLETADVHELQRRYKLHLM